MHQPQRKRLMNTTISKFFKRHHNESGKSRQKLISRLYNQQENNSFDSIDFNRGEKMSKTDKRAGYTRGKLSCMKRCPISSGKREHSN